MKYRGKVATALTLSVGVLFLSGCTEEIKPLDQTQSSVTEKYKLEDKGLSNKVGIRGNYDEADSGVVTGYGKFKPTEVEEEYYRKVNIKTPKVNGLTLQLSNEGVTSTKVLPSELGQYIALQLMDGQKTINLSSFTYLKANEVGGAYEDYKVTGELLKKVMDSLVTNYVFVNYVKGVEVKLVDTVKVLEVDYAVPQFNIKEDFKNVISQLDIYSTQLYNEYKQVNGSDLEFFISTIQLLEKQNIKPSKHYTIEYTTQGNPLIYANYKGEGNNPWWGYSRSIMTLAVMQKLYQEYGLRQPDINPVTPLWGAKEEEYKGYTDIQKRALVSWREKFNSEEPDKDYVYSFALTDTEIEKAGYIKLDNGLKVLPYEDYQKYFFSETEKKSK